MKVEPVPPDPLGVEDVVALPLGLLRELADRLGTPAAALAAAGQALADAIRAAPPPPDSGRHGGRRHAP
jgi:hypothetical protein